MACKFYKQKKQYSIDDGVTWIDVTPAEYRKGSLYELDSRDCDNVPIDYSGHYFTTVARENGTFSFEKTTGNTTDIQYSLDGGSTWQTLASGSTPTIAAGNKVYWKGTLTNTTTYPYGIGTFTSTGQFDVEGNIMSLMYDDNFIDKTSLTGKDRAFESLFINSRKVINAKNLILPAITLANKCYSTMFYDCPNLLTAPTLPATALADYCYNFMFLRCSNLLAAPALPATTLAEGCYSSMFKYCSNLTTAPTLPATTLAKWCYSEMFYGCSNLATAPALPALNLAYGCYSMMFWDCTNLTTAPALPATNLIDYCYRQMFDGCSNLNYIKCLATDRSAPYSTSGWANGVSSTGTFVKNSSMNSWPSGTSGIPSGWTIQNA